MLEQAPMTIRTVSIVGDGVLADENGVPFVPFATIPALLLGSLIDRGDVIEQGFLVHDEARDAKLGLEPAPLAIDPQRDDDVLDWEGRGDSPGHERGRRAGTGSTRRPACER